MNISIIVTLVGLCASISSIVFATLAFKKTEKESHKKEGKHEGLILSDIGYIKACVDRVEKNLNKVDERYRDVVERIANLEGKVNSMEKRVQSKGG